MFMPLFSCRALAVVSAVSCSLLPMAVSAQDVGGHVVPRLPPVTRQSDPDYNGIHRSAGMATPGAGFSGISVRLRNDSGYDVQVIDASGNDFAIDRHRFVDIDRQPQELRLRVTYYEDGVRVRKTFVHNWYSSERFGRRADEVEACVSITDDGLRDAGVRDCGG